MDDLISRQAAITLPFTSKEDREYQTYNLDDAYELGWLDYQKCIEDLPSAERRGRWIRTGEDGYCSVCKCDMPMFRNDWEWEYTETPYCPNCGARMEETP